MSSLDIRVCVEELRRQILGGKVEKVYHHPPDEIRFKIYAGGRKDLVIEAGKRIHLTRFPRESPRMPTSFAMLLRKHLEGARIKSVDQHDFDRVVVIGFERRDGVRYVVAELFSKGNVILLDEDMNVIMPLKHDNVKQGERYEFPEPKTNPLELSIDELRDIVKGEEREIVRILATRCGLGGPLAEEVCKRSGIDKKKVGKDLSDDEIERIYESMREVLNSEVRPNIVIKDGKYVDVLPVEFKTYEGYEKRYFETFNEALDEFYSRAIAEIAEREEEEEGEEVKRLKKRLEMQLQAKERFEREAEVYRRIGDLIYENYGFVERVVKAFRDALRRMPVEEVRRRAKSLNFVKEVRENSVVVKIDGYDVELEVEKEVHEIADTYYEKAKRAREKLEGLIKAIERTKMEIEKARGEKRFVKSIRVVRKREWYERFRWFITSDGYLVIGGRNAQMNEEIVSKYMESKDLFFHTQTPGGPVVILKRGQEAPESSIMEAAQFAAIYSSLWKEGRFSGEVYYVKPEQVKRSAKAGEYLPKGSFYIVGKRNYITVNLSCCIGVDVKNLRVMGGPPSAIKKHCDYYVEITIGDKDQNELSVEIASKLVSMAKEEERHIVRSIATPDEVMKFLPPGRSKIA